MVLWLMGNHLSTIGSRDNTEFSSLDYGKAIDLVPLNYGKAIDLVPLEYGKFPWIMGKQYT